MSLENIDGIIKTCRDIMRKDKGMNTDAQRLPQLLWMLCLKCFDDFERQKEVLGEHEQIIEESYRWRDWTDPEKGKRGEELVEFVNNNLFKYLQNLRGSGSGRDQRDIVADIFSEQKNYMTNGYLLKDIINQINKLDLTSSEQFHLIGTVYEKMLLAMRDDSPGSFGEFYTPRPVIKFMVEMINPSLKKRETILDPACGTAGFLIESFNYMEKQVKGTKDNEFLQKECLHGIEPRPDPYLFSLMNMMLHGISEPNIVRVNTLETPLNDIREN
ncbi:MAG: SAM-dependent DNA methyltransferase, partial [Thaumarchaeota archaeon]|nr:SAM-dependent DNA methyltransferase [Nitrososphaerota archaeon]